MQERRSLKRRDLIYYLRAFDRSKDQLLGHVANISPEGVMLVGEMRIEPAIAFNLRMDFPVEIGGRRALELEASSIWCDKNGHEGLFSTGFKLSNIGPDELKTIRHICSDPALPSKGVFDLRRLFDILASFLGLLVVSPAFLLIALAIKRDSPGPTFYMAERVGRLGRLFRMYKFRTMTEAPGRSGPKVTAYDDPRITSLGRFLRQTKLNELPQLLNVLLGEMSFVGPRPEYPEFVAHYAPAQREVLSVKPGITSLASILYAGEEKMLSYTDVTETYLRTILPDKLRLDLLYVRNRSMLLDIDVLLQTMLVLIPRLRKAAPQVEDIVRWPFRTARQRLSWFTIDAAIALLSVTVAGVLWRSAGPIDVGLGRGLVAALLMTATFSLTNWLTGVQRVRWHYASPGEAIYVIGSAALSTILLLAANSLVDNNQLPAQMLVVAGVFALIGFLVARFLRRLLQGLTDWMVGLRAAPAAGRERVLVVGAGDAGQLAVLLLRNSPSGRVSQVIGVVDDDLSLLGTLLHRVPVLGVCDQIAKIVREKNVGTIVFAIHSIDDGRRQYLIRRCQETSARMVILPDLLGNLRQDFPGENDGTVAPREARKTSQATMSFDRTSSDLRQQIHILAEQARNGDFARVAKELGELDTALRESEFAEPKRHRKRPQPNLKSGDQIHP